MNFITYFNRFHARLAKEPRFTYSNRSRMRQMFNLIAFPQTGADKRT